MGGDVEAISTEGKGSTFTFWLPAYSPAAMALAGGPVPEARQSIGAQRYNIVSDKIAGGEGAEQGGGAGGGWEYAEHVVERQQQQEDWGEEQASYGDGSGSYEEAGMDGVEVCRRLRMMLADTGVHLPIVMVTAQEPAAAAAGSAAAGADDYLTKPYTRDQLLRCVGSNLTKQSRAL
eukprot:gene9382-9546_t